MKRKNMFAVIISMLMVMAMLLAACGSKAPQTLEEYVNNDEDTKTEINQAAEEAGLEVSISGNDVIYTYDLKNFEGMTEELAKSDTIKTSLEQALNASGDTFTSLCTELEEESKIEGIRIIVNYTYDGEVLVTQTFQAAPEETGEPEETEE